MKIHNISSIFEKKVGKNFEDDNRNISRIKSQIYKNNNYFEMKVFLSFILNILSQTWHFKTKQKQF